MNTYRKKKAHQKASDREISLAYQEMKNVWKVAEYFGMCGQSVHERLVRIGEMKSMNTFSAEEKDRLKRDYLIYRDAGKLALLAKEMDRTKSFICRKAGELDLTDPRHKKFYAGTWKYMPEEVARVLFEKFRKASGTMTQFCKRHRYSDECFARTMRKFFLDEYEATIEAKAPRQSLYRIGRALEYRVRDELRKCGYLALRSPRSLGAVDIIGIRKGEVLLIQCKRGGGLSPKEWNALFELANSVGAVPLMASTPTGRGTIYHRLLEKKILGRKMAQPLELWSLRAISIWEAEEDAPRNPGAHEKEIAELEKQ